MISSDQWINLPVGNNLNDHVGVGNPSQLLTRAAFKFIDNDTAD